jgi:acetyl esterase/lipase
MSSWQNAVIKKILRRHKLKAVFRYRSIKSKRRLQERRAAILNLIPGGEFTDVKIGNIKGQLIEAENMVPGRIILYLHGGTYCTGSVKSYRILARKLADVCNSELLIINYRLAPENPYPGAIEDSMMAYMWLLDNGYKAKDIFIMGDSAGGGLALATGLKIKELGLDMPSGFVCMSPWTDLTLSGESFKGRAKRDSILNPKVVKKCAKLYYGDHDPADFLISPLFGDFTGFPPVMIQVGTEEMLYDDSARLVHKLKNSKVTVRFEVWKKMFHVWQFFYLVLPESKEAVEEIGKFVKDPEFNEKLQTSFR